MTDRHENQTRSFPAKNFFRSRGKTLGAAEKPRRLIWTSRLSVCAVVFFIGSAFAGADAPTAPDPRVAQAAEQVQKTQAETQKLKDAWDRSRLEATLYDQRAQRAYRRWVAAKKDWKKKMEAHKDRAQLEFELAVEKRKMAFSLWREAQYRLEADRQLLGAAEQKGNIVEIKNHLKDIQGKLDASAASGAKP